MATAELPNTESLEPARLSLFGGLWQRWLNKRRRDRARQHSQVKFRLTREGVHFVGILVFIFVGAVLRDINLLILLAGSMIGLILLQWRFNTSTLVGVNVVRVLPRSATMGKSIDVDLQMYNSKRWLNAWLVLVQDPIRRNLPNQRRLPEKGTGLVDSVRARGRATGRYQLVFHERGKYELGPSTLSTRFPLGLGRGWRTVDNPEHILVHPSTGTLTHAAKQLFHMDRMGQAKAAASAGVSEGEFFGLRPWETGDSRRWIHWRTTARMGEVAVRQFEQRHQRQICVLLDLASLNESQNEFAEQAISFLATIAKSVVSQGRDKLSAAIADAEVSVFPAIQSPVLVTSLLDRLAVAHSAHSPRLADALQSLNGPLSRSPQLLVISTRSDQTRALKAELKGTAAASILGRIRIRWLNVSAGDLEPYIQWT